MLDVTGYAAPDVILGNIPQSHAPVEQGEVRFRHVIDMASLHRAAA